MKHINVTPNRGVCYSVRTITWLWRSSLVEKVSEFVGEVWGDGGRVAHVPSSPRLDTTPACPGGRGRMERGVSHHL